MNANNIPAHGLIVVQRIENMTCVSWVYSDDDNFDYVLLDFKTGAG
jgi:hypothetical protein